MNLMSGEFFLFLCLTLVLYYLFPRAQKYILLTASLMFFLKASAVSKPLMCLLMAYIFFVTYLGAIAIEKTEGWKKDVYSLVSIIGLVATLFILKYAFNMGELFLSLLQMDTNLSWLDFVPIMGLSYFVLSAIGYLLDVRWQTCSAERNPTTVALFLYYFPQLISGPVTRFTAMREQFARRFSLQYENIEYGLRRMLWGYFKKLVISERFAMVVTTVYASPESYGGMDFVLATLCYAIQLYTDFSGCMDIVLGASALFGVRLPENFRAPFFSRSLQEFWQRWHITLGLWFKDYVMYPIQISAPMVSLGRMCKKRWGKKAGKKIPFYLSMIVLWFLIGVWHGCTAYYFVASALVPCTLLILSDGVSALTVKWPSCLRLESDNIFVAYIQRVRTLLLICICWVFVCAGSVSAGISVFVNMVSNFSASHFYDILNTTGIDGKKAVFMFLCLMLLVFAEYLENKGSSIQRFMDGRHYLFRIGAIYLVVFLILGTGMIGKSTFIYFQF